MDESTAQPQAPRRSSPGAAPRPFGGASRGPAPTGGEEVRGTVKWFNQAKGFGFITPETGGKDVFVHVSVLARSGLVELSEGQAVRVRVAQGAKGPEAALHPSCPDRPIPGRSSGLRPRYQAASCCLAGVGASAQ